MSKTPYFSIIVPMYNAARYIKICIDSILAQTFQDFEVIIIDDVSTDDSYKICTELYGDNEKVRLLRHEKNQGQGPARNTGIKNARGKYIGFVDNDDAIIPTALEKLHKATNFNGVEVDVIHCFGRYITFQNDDKNIDMSNLTLYWENRSEGFVADNIEERILEHWIKRRVWLAAWLNIYRRQFLIKNEIKFSDSRGEDIPIAFKALCLAEKYFMLKNSVYIWRQRPDSVSHSKNLEQFFNSIKSIFIIANEIEDVISKIPKLNSNRFLKEQCIVQGSATNLFDEHIHPLYNGINIPQELDQVAYNALLPIFGENTTLVKYLFHGFNTMWRQANILAGQNYLLRQRDELIKQQNKILEQMNLLLAQQNKLQRD